MFAHVRNYSGYLCRYYLAFIHKCIRFVEYVCQTKKNIYLIGMKQVLLIQIELSFFGTSWNSFCKMIYR